MTLDGLARERRVIVCVGGGGVGKTTVSAALALAGARAGRRSVVVTVDPARRLADALGVDLLSDEPRTVATFDGGRLDAAMLDQKRAWDRMVAAHAPSPVAAKRLLANPIYRELSRSFAGTHEFLAVERLCALVDAGAHDLIVLDTPPASQAVEIFDAPARLRGLLDRRVMRWLVRPTAGLRAVGRLAHFLLAELEAAVGASALTDAGDFFVALAALLESFDARGRELEALLRVPSTALVLVVAPDARAIGEAQDLRARTRAIGVEPSAVVVNRVHARGPRAQTPDIVEALRYAGIEAHAKWMAENYQAYQRLAESEVKQIRSLDAPQVIVLPNLEADVHDLATLQRLLP